MTSQQIIDKLIQIELYRIHPNRNPTRDELSWEVSNNFFAKPFKREFANPMDLDYEKEYFITNLDCERGYPKLKLAGIDKMYDYKDFTYRVEETV